MSGSEPQNKAETEINELKETYGCQCKVIRDMGDFAFIVSVKFSDKDLTIKFQIEDVNMVIPAQMLIRSAKITDTQQKEILNSVSHPNNTLLTSTNAALQWISEHGISLALIRTPPRSPRQKKSRQKTTKNAEDVHENTKAPSMKTAVDVIHRILWDDQLSTDNFVIGYLDRFIGVVEKPFVQFSWEDLASLDYDVFAVPKHRIQYFKYKSRIIWDKASRRDDVFGSTGGKENLLDIMIQVDEEEKKEKEAKPLPYPDSDESDDSDDDVEINLGGSAVGNEEQLYPREKYWGKRSRPTHFLALRINDQHILDNVSEVQEEILRLNPEYVDCVIPVTRQHMTLACLGLDTPDEIQKATRVLMEIQNELCQLKSKDLTVSFTNLNQFFNNTLYAEVESNEALLTFVNHLKTSLSEAGIEIRDVFDFVPHTTIVKLSSQFGREQRTRYLDPRVMAKFGTMRFGSQLVDNIHLCEMSDNRQDDGFYICPSVIQFH